MAYKKGRSGDPLVEAIQHRALDVYARLLGPCERRAGSEQYWRTPWRADNKPSLRVNQRGFWFDDPASEGGNVFQMWARFFGLEMPREFGTVKQEIAEALGLNAYGKLTGKKPGVIRSSGTPVVAQSPRRAEVPAAPCPHRQEDGLKGTPNLPRGGEAPPTRALATPTPQELAAHYGLLWEEFEAVGCEAQSNITANRIAVPGVVYPLRAVDGGIRRKAKSLARFDPKNMHRRECWGYKFCNYPDGARLAFHPGGGAGFFPPSATHGKGELALTAGEEKALALRKAGYRAVSWSAGEGGIRPEVAAALVAWGNLQLLVAMDADEAGRHGAAKAAENLHAAGAERVRVLEWNPDRPKGWDVNDELKMSGIETLRALLDGAPVKHPAVEGVPAGNEQPKAEREGRGNPVVAPAPGPAQEHPGRAGMTSQPPTEPAEIIPMRETTTEKDDEEMPDSQTDIREGWEAPVELEEARAPEFPLAAIAHIPWMKAWIEGLAEAYQTPLDLPGILTIGAVAGAMQRRVVVRPREGWNEPLNLYAVVALPPGTNKSQVHREVTAPILQWEQDRNEASRSERELFDIDRSLLETRIDKLKRRAASEGESPDDRRELSLRICELQKELRAIPPSAEVQLLFDDTTAEALELAMVNSGQAVVASAEGKLFDNMAGAYSRVPNINIYLKAHAGDPIAVNRIGRERVMIKEPRLTMLMTVQPQVVEGLATRKEFDGRGLLARFLYSLPPSMIGARKENPAPVGDDVRADYHLAMRRLLDYGNPERTVPLPGVPVPQDGPDLKPILFSPEADSMFRNLRENIEARLAPDASDLDGLGGWANKLAGLVARLAGALHCAAELREPWSSPVSAHTMQQAIALAQYATDHARAAFHIMGSDADTDNACYLRDRLLLLAEEDGSATLPRQRVWQQTKTRMHTADQLDKSLRVLETRGYLRTIDIPRPSGRPARCIALNPIWSGINPPAPSRPLMKSFKQRPPRLPDRY